LELSVVAFFAHQLSEKFVAPVEHHVVIQVLWEIHAPERVRCVKKQLGFFVKSRERFLLLLNQICVCRYYGFLGFMQTNFESSS
jgi:hypothetical protein